MQVNFCNVIFLKQNGDLKVLWFPIGLRLTNLYLWGIAKDKKEAAKLAATAGSDMDMGRLCLYPRTRRFSRKEYRKRVHNK